MGGGHFGIYSNLEVTASRSEINQFHFVKICDHAIARFHIPVDKPKIVDPRQSVQDVF